MKMPKSYSLTVDPEGFTITRSTDGVSVKVGRAADADHMTPLELFVASVVACTASTVAGMLRADHDLDTAPEMTYRYTQAMGATHEVQRIAVSVAGIPGHAEIDVVNLAHEAEETRCAVSLSIKKPPRVEFVAASE